MSLNGARLRYVDENGQEVLVPAKGRTFQIGSYFSCDLILEPQAERLICEIKCDAFGRVTIHNQSTKETTIHLNDKIIHGQRGHPLLPGNRITILDRVYTWECHKVSGSEDVPGTPERLSPVEQAPNSCPSLKSHRPQLDKRLTVHNFRYSINSDDEGNTSIESRGLNESHLEAEEESLNFSTPPSTEVTSCETPKVDLVEATQNKENTATPPATHQQLLQLCALSDVVITSFSPRETGVKVEKSFTCVRKPTKMGKQAAASVTMSTPKSVYSTPKGGVLSELNDDSCSRDLVDFSTPSTSKKTKRESSMYLIDLTTPSKLRPSFKQQLPTPISVDSTDESSEGSPFVIDITKSDTPPTPSRSHLAKTPRRPVAGDAATPTRTPRSLMKVALLTSTKKKLIAANQKDRTPVATPKTRPDLQEARRLSRTSPRLPFASALSGILAAQPARGQAPNTTPRKRQSLHLGTPRDNKLSQIRKSLAAAKRSSTVDLGNRLKAKARRTLNSPKSGSPKSASPAPRKTINLSQAKCSTPEKLNESSTKDDLSRTFTIMNESGDPEEGGSVLGMIAALVTGEEDDSSVASKVLDTILPAKEIKEHSLAEDQHSRNLETEEKVAPPNQENAKLDDVGTKTLEGAVEDQKELELNPKESIQNSPIEVNENIIIEDSICEEIHANIPKPIDDDAKEVPSAIKSSDSVAEAENQEPDSRVETPQIRRSLRRLSVDQKAGVATTPRRRSSSRRASVKASSSSKTEDSKMGTRRASCSALDSGDQAVSGTPRRKRRFTEEMGTPTRQSKRLMTPKRALPVDESIGDMGVIVEEDDDAPPAIVEDENYGKELPSDEPDNVNYQGLRDLLKTPKNCSTPRFKGLREMMRTPKVAASPIFGNIEELLDNSMGSTPHRNKASRSVTVARVAVEKGKTLDGVLKTPSARNIMVPIEPASAVLKSRGDSLAATTEYDLEMTNTTLHLDQIFDDVPSTSVANMEDTEAEINVTALSTASALDPLRESVSSEAPMSVCKPAATDKASHKNDPLTSTTYKAAMQADLELSATFTEEVEATSRASSPGSNEMSGMQLLDQTSDSMFSEPLMVSGVDSCKDVTIDETRALGQTTCPPLEVNEIDTDSNVGLTEPLVFSDDEEETEAGVTPKKSADHNEVSMAYQLEGSSSSNGKKELMPGEEQSVKETPALDESKTRENDSLLEEVSIIEVDKSVHDDSINATNDGISLIIELDSSSDTEEPPKESAKDNNESAAGEVTIVESETFPLDSTEDLDELSTSVDQKPVESGSPISEAAKIGTEDPTHPLATEVRETLSTEEEVAEKSISADVASTDNGKENDEESKDVPVDLTAEGEVDQKRKQSIEEDSVGKLAEEDQPLIDALSSKELAEEKATANNVSLAVQSQTFPLDSTADSSMEAELSFNVVPKPDTNQDFADKSAEEDNPAIDALPSEELAEEKTTRDDTAVDADDFPLDSTAETSVIVEEAKADQQPIDSALPGKPAEEDLPAADLAEEKTTEEVGASTDELPIDATTPDAVTDDTTAESLGQDVEPNQLITKPEVGEVSLTSEVSPVEAEKPEQSYVEQHSADAEPLSLDTEAEPSTAEVPLVETEEAKQGDVENDDTNAEPVCLDETPIQNESASTVTKPGVKVSLPIDAKSEVEPSTPESTSVETEEAKEEDKKNVDTSEEPKSEAEQSTLVEAKEPEKGDVEEVSSFATATPEGFVPETPTPNTQDVELASPADETAPKDKASPGPSPAAVEGDDIIPEIIPATLEGDIIMPETSAAQDLANSDTVPIDLAQEVSQESSIQENNLKQEATETEIVADKNPSEAQQSNGVEAETPATEETSKLNEADKTQEESVCEAESDKGETTTDQLPLDESIPGTPAVESPLNEVVPTDESNATDITAVDDQQERDVRAPEDSVVTVILDDDSTSMETTQNESCVQEPASPKVNKADEQTPLDSAAIEVDSSFCSLIEESFTEQPREDFSDSKEKGENTPNQDESEDEVIQLDASSIVEDVAEDSVIEETPTAKSFVNDQEVEEVESKPTDETSAQLKELHEDEVISMDTSPKETLEEETAQNSPPVTAESSFAYNLDASQDDSVSEQKPDEVATAEISRGEPISDVLESSAALEALSSSAVQDTSVVESPDISTSEALNSSKDIEDEDDGPQEAGSSEEHLTETTDEDATGTITANESSRDAESAKEKPQQDESTSIAAESEDKSQDQNAREVEELDKAAQEIQLPSLTKEVALDELETATNVPAKSIEEEALDTVIHQSVTEIMSEVLTEETASQATEPNTNIEEQTQSDDHHMEAKSQAEKAILAAAVEDADVIELSDDSESESPPGKDTSVEEDTTATVSASEAVTSVQVIETLTTEDPKEDKVEDVPQDFSVALQKVESAATPVINREEDQAEKPQISEECASEAVKRTAVTESDTKAQDESVVEGSADEESPAPEKDKSRGVEADSEHLPEVEASKKKASNCEDDEASKKEAPNTQGVEPSKKQTHNSEDSLNEKLAAPNVVSLESETSEILKNSRPEPSVSPKHSTMNANSPSASQPLPHEDVPSDKDKEEFKPVKRATRKGSASVESPAEDVLEKPSRRARKPSAEVEEFKLNDVHEKPKRRAASRKPSAEVAESIEETKETKEEEVLNVIPEEEPHSSRPNQEEELQEKADTHPTPEADVLEKPRRRARKPSEEVKSAEITEKPKRRARKPSAEPMLPIQKEIEAEVEPKVEEKAHSSKINTENELQKEAETSQKEEDHAPTKPRHRGRQPSAEEETLTDKGTRRGHMHPEEHLEEEKEITEESNEQNEPPKQDKMVVETRQEEIIKSHTEKPKRRGRKASTEETETTSGKKPKTNDLTPEEDAPKLNQDEQQPEKPKRRARKASAEEDANNVVKKPSSEEVLQSIVEEETEAISTVDEAPEDVPTEGKSRRRGRKPSREEVVAVGALPEPLENPLTAVPEDQSTNPTEQNGPQEPVPAAEVEEAAKEADPIERPRRRGRKPSVDTEHVAQDVPDKPRRRGRTPANHEKPPSEDEPDKKTRRTARKPSAEPVEAPAPEAEQHLKDIEEVAEPETEPEAASKQLLEEEQEEPKTRRRARKPVPAKKDPPEEAPTRRRGRKATEDEAPKSEPSLETKTSIEEEQPKEVPEDEVQELPADVAAETPVAAPEKKSTRRVRKASANVDEGTKAAAAKKAPIRRGRKEEDLVTDEDVQETQIDLQQVPMESVPAVVVRSGSVSLGASEDELTPRRREGRNMPRKNYDETSDEDKQRSARKARKPVASRLLALKAPEEEAATPPPKRQPVEEVDTPANTVPTPEPSTSQRREGRNVPRKNYTEAPDDDKPSTSRSRRMRNLTAKALELIVDSSPRPNTPRGRKGKAAVENETPAKAAPPPPAQAESGAEEEPAPVPVIAKGRGARRKADDDLVESGMAAPPPSKRGARGQTEETEEQPPEAAKPAKKNARATARKAKVESESESEPVPAKKARGGARAKTPVEKSAAEQEEHPLPIKKGRGGARAKTPVAVIPDESATEPEEETAKKPAARSRARGAKATAAVPEPEQPAAAQDSDAEAASTSSTSASRGGRAKKVHFEPTQTAATTADASTEDAPKRATRSRRK